MEDASSPCDNFLYGFKGAPSARQAGPGRGLASRPSARLQPTGSAHGERSCERSGTEDWRDLTDGGRQPLPAASALDQRPARAAAARAFPRIRPQPGNSPQRALRRPGTA